jgi:hypothetical protein
MATNESRAHPRGTRIQPLFMFFVIVVVSVLFFWVSRVRHNSGTVAGNASAFFAGVVGMLQISFGLVAAAVRASAAFQDDPEEADGLRREGLALLLGAGALISSGSALILLSLAGPVRVVPSAVGLAGWLSLYILAAVLVALRWRGLDELNRAAARESDRLAFKWMSLVGSAWAMLAHLDFVAAPSPLDWLTMLGGASFIASLVAAGRMGAFDAPGSGSRPRS